MYNKKIKSKYNIVIENNANEELLLFNSLRCSFISLDNFSKGIFENIEDDANDLSTPEASHVIDVLYENGFLIDFDFDEYKYMTTLSQSVKYNTRTLLLTIAPTTACNMECPYCYERITPKTMSKEVQDSILKFVENEFIENNYNSLSVTWYGGEPLLCKDIIISLSKSLINICESSNVKYDAEIITNGVLLDYETCLMLSDECKIQYAQITMDGLKNTHNSRRKLRNGEDSFFKILENIDTCKDLLNIRVRVNVDTNNVNEIPSLIDMFINKKDWVNKVNFYLAPVEITESCTTCLHSSSFSDLMTKILKECVNKGYTKLLKLLYPSPLLVNCAAVTTKQFIVAPDGYLYRCYREIGQIEASIGNITNKISSNKILVNKNFLDWLNLELPDTCADCKLLPVCQGGCAFKRKTKSYSKSCQTFTHNYKDFLLLTYSLDE